MRMLKYNPNDHFHLNTALLVIGVIVGIILRSIFNSTLLLIGMVIITKYKWIIDCFNRIVYSDQVKLLDHLTNSVSLADKRDNYAIGRYRNAVNNRCSGVSNTVNLQEIANEVGDAFYHSANLYKVSNGIVVYKINLNTEKGCVHDTDF